MEQSPSLQYNGFSASQEIPAFYGIGRFITAFKRPATCPYPDPARSSPHFPSHFLKIHFNIIPHLRLGFPSGLFPSDFPNKTLYTPPHSSIRAACPAHLIPLDLVAQKMYYN